MGHPEGMTIVVPSGWQEPPNGFCVSCPLSPDMERGSVRGFCVGATHASPLHDPCGITKRLGTYRGVSIIRSLLACVFHDTLFSDEGHTNLTRVF